MEGIIVFEDMFWDSVVFYFLDQGGMIFSIREYMNIWVKNGFFLCIYVFFVIIEFCLYYFVVIYFIFFYDGIQIFL